MYVWLVIHRQRTLAAEDALEDAGLDLAIVARRAEGGIGSTAAVAMTPERVTEHDGRGA
jgi:hypothetical protein